MHKCIKVKIGGSKKCEFSEKRKVKKNCGKCKNLVEIGGIYKFFGKYEEICIIGVGGVNPCLRTSFFYYSSMFYGQSLSVMPNYKLLFILNDLCHRI